MKTILFMGTPNIAATILKDLINLNKYKIIGVVTKKDMIVGRKKQLTSSPVKNVALENDLPIYQPDTIEEMKKQLKDISCDLIITVAYGKIIPKQILEIPKYKAINVHGSLLPKYRGGAPIQRAIMQGEKQTGVTIMYMNEKMDAGNIISQAKIEIPNTMTSTELFLEMTKVGSSELIKQLDLIFENKNESIIQDENKVTYANILRKEDEIIDYKTFDSIKIHNYIRGLSLNPGATIFKNETRYKILNSQITNRKVNEKGLIFDLENQQIGIVGTDNIFVQVKQIQMQGKKMLTAKEFLNGMKNA